MFDDGDINDLEVTTMLISSRIVTIFMWLLLDWLVVDHIPTGDVAHFQVNDLNNKPSFLQSFTAWDASHYLSIARYGYTSDQSYVFLPVFPFTMSLVRFVLHPFLSTFLSSEEMLVVSGLLLSNFAFVLSGLVLKRLCDHFNFSSISTRLSILFFAFNPASVFFSAIYTESLYSLFTFLGVYFHERAQLGLSSISLLTASGIRSNGWMNVIAVLFHAFLQGKSCYFFQYVPAISSILPFLCWNIMTYEWIMAEDLGSVSALSPFVYGYLQEKYWGVGFMKQYQLRQFPNFLIALPTIYFVYTYVLNTSTRDGENFSFCLRYRYHLVGVVILVLVFAHVQIMARVVFSSCPIVYLCLPPHFTGKLWNNLKFCVCYFVVFFISGIALHCNNYPWT